MADVEQAKLILRELLENRGTQKTICPSEAARALAQSNWREALPLVRQAAELMRQEGHLQVEQGGEPVDPAAARGPIRYRLVAAETRGPILPEYIGGTKFSTNEIERARELKQLGLSWNPRPGHYVWDEHGLIEKSSPFQPQVYFILDLKHFLRRAGSTERLQQLLVWLPTWEDLRGILHSLGWSQQMIAQHLQETRSLETGNERLALYDLTRSILRAAADS